MKRSSPHLAVSIHCNSIVCLSLGNCYIFRLGASSHALTEDLEPSRHAFRIAVVLDISARIITTIFDAPERRRRLHDGRPERRSNVVSAGLSRNGFEDKTAGAFLPREQNSLNGVLASRALV
jgi:hypothetical protein